VARAEGQDFLLQSVVMILARHRTRSPQDIAARTALLGPVLEQNEAIRLYLKARRTVQDVNPETGAQDPTGAAGAPGVEAAPAGGKAP